MPRVLATHGLGWHVRVFQEHLLGLLESNQLCLLQSFNLIVHGCATKAQWGKQNESIRCKSGLKAETSIPDWRVAWQPKLILFTGMSLKVQFPKVNGTESGFRSMIFTLCGANGVHGGP